MRVANKTVYGRIIYNLSNITEDLNKSNEVVSSAKRINNLSDDPVGLTQALNIRSSLDGIKQMKRNMSLGKSYLSSAESALSLCQDLIIDAKNICIKMVDSSVGASERASAAEDVDNILDEIVSLANTDVNGWYVFGGYQSSVPPFQSDGTYVSDTNTFSIKISSSTSIEVGMNGSDVFGSLFTTLSNLKTALETNDVDGIRTAMDELDDHFDHITNRISDVGSKIKRIEIKEKLYQDLEIESTQKLSLIEDADIAKAIVELKSKELAYQAALASSSKVMQLSLVDYL